MGYLDGMTGNIETACLIIKDYRSTSGAGASPLAGAGQALGGNVAQQVAGGADKIFKVQFNPSEIQIYATSLKIDQADTRKIDQNVRAVSGTVLKPTVEMTVNLVFDRVNNTDAFLWDKLNTALTANTLVSAGKALAGKQYTVQPEVDGLIAALRNRYTRNVVFQWAKFSFSGVLKFVSANYTMFSPSGRPIRASVMLRLRQEMSVKNLKTWYDDFDQAFGGDMSSLVRPEQQTGALLNLGL